METIVNYVLAWTCNGKRHTKSYDSDSVAQLCFDECKSIPSHSDVTLTRVTAEVISSTEKPRKKLRHFAVLRFKTGTDLETKYFELLSPTAMRRFEQCLSDRDIFSITFYSDEVVPHFIRKHGFIPLK